MPYPSARFLYNFELIKENKSLIKQNKKTKQKL